MTAKLWTPSLHCKISGSIATCSKPHAVNSELHDSHHLSQIPVIADEKLRGRQAVQPRHVLQCLGKVKEIENCVCGLQTVQQPKLAKSVGELIREVVEASKGEAADEMAYTLEAW